MPLFYFNIRVQGAVFRDEEGMAFPNLEAARKEASLGARAMLADALRAHREMDSKSIEILDENRVVLEAINIRDVLI